MGGARPPPPPLTPSNSSARSRPGGVSPTPKGMSVGAALRSAGCGEVRCGAGRAAAAPSPPDAAQRTALPPHGTVRHGTKGGYLARGEN